MDDLIGRRYTREFLETLSETEVRLSERALIRHINALRSCGQPSYSHEIELCHVQDEINRRKVYQKSMPGQTEQGSAEAKQ